MPLLPGLLLVSLAALEPEPAAPAPPSDAQVRLVVSAVVAAAEAERGRRTRDELFDAYVRAAAAGCQKQRLPARAFLIGLGVALDHGDLLRSNPLTRLYLTRIESDAERRKRLAVLGAPTLHGRRDWVQHFAVSAALTAMSGAGVAEQVGIAKEMLDARAGGSGFSFGDLAADLAGIALAEQLLQRERDGKPWADLESSFRGTDILPAAALRLEEGLGRETFRQRYGDTGDARFRKALDDVRRTVREAPAFRTPAGSR